MLFSRSISLFKGQFCIFCRKNFIPRLTKSILIPKHLSVFFSGKLVFFPPLYLEACYKFVRMEQAAWKRLLTFYEKTYYTEIVVILASLFLLYVIIKYFSKKKFAYLFLVYAITCIILFLGFPIQRSVFPPTGRLGTVVIESVNTLFAISELSVFIIFFFQIINSKSSKKLLLLILSLFFISIIYFLSKLLNLNSDRSEIMKASLFVNILEFSIFLVAVLSYFMELFTKPPTQNLALSPAFWISSGLFIYILGSLPLLLFAEYIWAANRNLYYLLFSIHFLSLSLLLLTISKAFLCPEPLTA